MIDKIRLAKYRKILNSIETVSYTGIVTQVIGLTVESQGPAAEIGEVCNLYSMKGDKVIKAEVVGFKNNRVLLMPYGDLIGIGPGSKVESTHSPLKISVSDDLIGKVVDALGNPFSNPNDKILGDYYSTENKPPNPLTRKRITEPISLGIRAIDGILTCGAGQRMGIFAGSGVGKSTLLGMIARNTSADINVIALVGERGREVREFIEKDLKDGLKRSVVIVATSDQPALMRIKGAMTATAIAEYFRDRGYNTLLMMDSLTRFAMAQREVGLAVGEPPVSRGYTPSVFSVLPKLLERTGNSETGSITGLYTVLVEGDDFNEPVSDTVRGILDGHIMLSRSLANNGHYPAIDVLESVSRVMPDIVSEKHYSAATNLKSLMSAYKEAEDLINIGAYQKGSNKKVDEALQKISMINSYLTQKVNECTSYDMTLDMLLKI